VSFFTVVITGRWFSLASDTLFYARLNNHIADTVAFTHLDEHLSFTDTPSQYCPCFLQFTIDSACGDVRNSFLMGDQAPVSLRMTYIAGLGRVQAGHARDDGSETDTALDYYAKTTGRGQTPYYTSAISEVGEAMTNIKLYPSPAAHLLYLSFPEALRHISHLIITDALGQTVYSSAITDRESTHDISHLPSGIYMWQISTEQGIIKTGKVVKE
jgi:hypothetical protein